MLFRSKKGYRAIGMGVDQAAFLSPDKRAILKIFGTKKRFGPEKLSNAQNMFITWANYCAVHRDNPYLIKFLKGENGKTWTPFIFNGHRYIQMWQEFLPALSYQNSKTVAMLSGVIRDTSREEFSEYLKALDLPASKRPYGTQIARFLKAGKKYLGSGFPLFVNTVMDLKEIAKQNGARLDLLLDNFRRRADGTPVIVDPWYAN